MAKEKPELYEGQVIKIEKNGYIVELDAGLIVFCYPSGNIRRHKISILTTDRVIVEISGYDTTKGRLIKRI